MFVDFVVFGSIHNNLILENYLTMHVSMHIIIQKVRFSVFGMFSTGP